MEHKLDKILDRISNIDVTLAKQEVSLSEHIKRTAILEAKLEPVERHVILVNGLVKVITALAALVAVLSYFK